MENQYVCMLWNVKLVLHAPLHPLIVYCFSDTYVYLHVPSTHCANMLFIAFKKYALWTPYFRDVTTYIRSYQLHCKYFAALPANVYTLTLSKVCTLQTESEEIPYTHNQWNNHDHHLRTYICRYTDTVLCNADEKHWSAITSTRMMCVRADPWKRTRYWNTLIRNGEYMEDFKQKMENKEKEVHCLTLYSR